MLNDFLWIVLQLPSGIQPLCVKKPTLSAIKYSVIMVYKEDYIKMVRTVEHHQIFCGMQKRRNKILNLGYTPATI